MNRSEGQHSCPSNDELKGFSIGRLPERALNRVAAHIEARCPRCVAVLEELEELEYSADPLLADLPEPPPISAAEADEVCRCVLEHVLGLAASSTDGVPLWPSDIAAALDKTPPDAPGLKTSVAPIGKPGGWPKMGGMGAVWLVRDLQFERLLALKVMKSDRANSDRICRFLNEARITARLAHPSVVPVHAMGWLADGRPYYTMKLVEGDTLADRLKSGSDVTSERLFLLQVFARVCQALAFAHYKGVIHRDLKPIHVMVGAHGEVYIIDWGLAKVFGQSDVLAPAESSPWLSPMWSIDGQAMGTWPYMPPEQANGQINDMDRRSDVFGLGAILCEILTGEPPYVGPPDDVKRHACRADLAGAYARLASCGADDDLIKLAKRCLVKKPEHRLKDAGEVATAVTTYLADVEERAQKAKLAQAVAEEKAERAREKAEAERRARELAEKARWRMLWGSACAALFLVALTGAGFFAWRHSEARQKILADTLDRAFTAAMSGDLDAAEKATAEAERAGASTGRVEMLRGQIALHRGQSQKARQHLEEAVRLLPDSVPARGMLAAAYADDGHWERYDRMIREMEELTPSAPEDFLFKGYAEANLEPARGLETIKQAFARRPMMGGIELLLRAEVRALVAQDTDPEEAEGAVQDAKYARELLHDNPRPLWVSLNAHLAKAGVHEYRGEQEKRRAELELAGKDADALKDSTALPEAVVYRWLYFRELGRQEEVLDELRRASENTDHVYATYCCALTLYRRGQPGDLEEALRVLEKRPGTYNDRLLPFVLAEHDYRKADWPARALKVSEKYAAQSRDGAAVMDTQGALLCLLGKKREAVEASKALLKRQDQFYTLRREPILRCVRYIAGELSAEELLGRAGRSQWDQCLAHYYIAMNKLTEGDRQGAKEHFKKVIKTRAFLWGPYDMSWVFLSRLEKPSTWPPWISNGRAN
jgi:predicted Zn-dependent protease